MTNIYKKVKRVVKSGVSKVLPKKNIYKNFKQEVTYNTEVVNGEDVIKSAVIANIYKEEEVEFESVFHYRIGKELKLTHPNENGEYADVYCKTELKHGNEIDYKHWHENIERRKIANYKPERLKYVYPITKEEYEEAAKK